MSDALDWDLPCVSQPRSLAELDDAGYLLLNPDVRQAGTPAADHFIQLGQKEGRRQAINLDRVLAMRERKLSGLRFRVPPVTCRAYGEAANFITPAMRAEFGIPEHPPVSDHIYSGMTEMLRDNPDKLFLDVGAGLRSSVSINMVNTEIYSSISTDVVCVGEELPFDDAQFDVALCAAVLEHTRRPWDVAREICRVVRPGGMIRIDYPCLAAVHGYPHHYFNATPQGVISLFEKDCEIRSSTIDPHNHPIQALWWILALWREGLAVGDRARFESLTVGDILSRPPEAQLGDDFCRGLSGDIQRIIPAGSTLVAIRK